MDKHDKIINDANKKTVEGIIMSLGNTQLGKYFNVPLYRFMWQVMAGVNAVISLWYMLVGRGGANEKEIKNVGGQVAKVETKLDKHIEDVKNAPLTTVGLQSAVTNNSDDIKDLTVKVSSHDKTVTKNETTIDIVRADQVIMQKDIKEILKLIKQNGN